MSQTPTPRALLYTIEDCSGLAARCLAELGAAGQIELVCRTHEPYVPPVADELRGFDAVLGELCPVKGPTVGAFAEAGVRLYVSLSIGMNHVDVAGLARRGVLVANCPGYCADDVALHAIALMLDLMRQVTLSHERVLGGSWNPKLGYPMRRPWGQTLGLVFFGAIGSRVAALGQGLGMHVLVWAPTKSASELAEAGCEKVGELDELLRRSDVVSLHCPLIPLTEGLIGARELALMRPTAFLINTARGAVVDEAALADALVRGVIRGAGIDVLADETAPVTSPLIGAPNCVVTPHTAYVSEEADEALVRLGLTSAVELLVNGHEPRRLVRP